MVTKVHAIYRNGALFLERPLSVPEGSEVELTVESGNSSATLAAALDEIAGLPMRSAKDGFSGAEHDRVLYPERTGK